MGRLQAEVVLELGDRSRTFALKASQIENLEKEVGEPISNIAYRVIGMRPAFKDIKHIIILGLEGAGTPPEEAARLFSRYVEGRPLMDRNDQSCPVLVAARIMEAAWFGIDDILKEEESSGKPEAEAPPATE